jgi:hypothetical protein
VRTVSPAQAARRTHYNSPYDLAFFNHAARRSLFNGASYNISDIRVLAPRTAENPYTHQLFRAGIIGDF